MIHDDWAGRASIPKAFRRLLHRLFKAVYTQASSRFCVSESMEAEYRKRYKVGGTVLLPFRGPDSPRSLVRMRQRRASDPLKVAFAGSIANADYWRLLRELATALNLVGGRLDLYTDVTQRAIVREGLDRPEVEFHGFLRPTELAERLGESADILFAPASFAPIDSDYMRTCFPSKLVEYTAIGIPILIWGPEYSAAVQWGRGSGGAAEVVADPAPEAIAESLRRLSSDPEGARKMAETALELGNEQFSFERALTVFDQGLLQNRSRVSQ
jgi:glycosyltransferase involved in cell wall biosynthesis